MQLILVPRNSLITHTIGISKQEAAKRINVSQPAYLRYESGQRNPSIQVIKEMARVFNTSVEYLLGESNDFEPSFLTISKSDEPVFFEIASSFKAMDESQKKRLIEYMKVFLANKKEL